MSAVVARALFRVRIHYREPTYELYTGHGAPEGRPYRWTCEVAAENAEEAKALAVQEFEQVGRDSNVGWRRQIVLIELPGGRDG